MQGWLCPATLLYFADYPAEIWFSAEPLSEEDSKEAQATRKVRDDAEDAKWEQWRANNPASRPGTLSRTLSERYNVGSAVPGWEPLGGANAKGDEEE